MATQTPHPINQALLDAGWKNWPVSRWDENKTLYAKTFEGHAKCKCNSPKFKQIEIYHHPAERISSVVLPESWSVECVGQLPDNEWLRMQVEGLNDLSTILRTVDQLLQIWDHATSIVPTIDEPD